MITSKIFYLCQLLQKTEIGRFSKVIGNYIELFSEDSDILNKLNALKFMKGFNASIYYSKPKENFNIARIFQKETAEEFSIEKKVETEFNNIFKEYGNEIDFIYCPDKSSIMIESEDLELIRKIYLNLKNFDYINIDGYKHLFIYCY